MMIKQSYRALTRTYRPSTFDDIVSQEHVSSTLKNAIRQNRISHAYMFCGPRGVGKTTMARVLARAVNEVDSDVDGESLDQTMNIVEMDAASNRKIDDVRSLKEVIRVPPQNGRFKIFIIDEVHMLTKEAFNALLKTLEEPPPHAIFIFATTEPHKVLPTILSRVQRFDFKRISVSEIVSRLSEIAEKEDVKIDEESLHVIAKRADGALRDALGLMDQAIAYCGKQIGYQELLSALNVVDRNHLIAFVDAVRKRDASAGLHLIRDLVQSGTDIQEFLVSLTEHLRNLYMAAGVDAELIEATKETRELCREQASHFSTEDLMRMLHLVNETQYRIRDARQPRVLFELLLIRLVHMNRGAELGDLISRLDELKKKGGSSDLNGSVAEASEDSDEPEKAGKASGAGEKKADPEVTKSEPAVVEKERVEPDAEAEENIFGRPSLDGPSQQNNGNSVPLALPLQEESSPTSGEEIKITFDGVRSKWETFLDGLSEEAPQLLYYQMQRVRLHKLAGRELTLLVDNDFSRNMVEENRNLLCRLLSRVCGAPVQIRCVVSREPESERQEEESPYERFKALQQKDPNLRLLVELFGAELEY
ncbi:MAG: DNA polymerase III subunit gamma/tau [Balneolaceae bacterium]